MDMSQAPEYLNHPEPSNCLEYSPPGKPTPGSLSTTCLSNVTSDSQGSVNEIECSVPDGRAQLPPSHTVLGRSLDLGGLRPLKPGVLSRLSHACPD